MDGCLWSKAQVSPAWAGMVEWGVEVSAYKLPCNPIRRNYTLWLPSCGALTRTACPRFFLMFCAIYSILHPSCQYQTFLGKSHSLQNYFPGSMYFKKGTSNLFEEHKERSFSERRSPMTASTSLLIALCPTTFYRFWLPRTGVFRFSCCCWLNPGLCWDAKHMEKKGNLTLQSAFWAWHTGTDQ